MVGVLPQRGGADRSRRERSVGVSVPRSVERQVVRVDRGASVRGEVCGCARNLAHDGERDLNRGEVRAHRKPLAVRVPVSVRVLRKRDEHGRVHLEPRAQVLRRGVGVHERRENAVLRVGLALHLRQRVERTGLQPRDDDVRVRVAPLLPAQAVVPHKDLGARCEAHHARVERDAHVEHLDGPPRRARGVHERVHAPHVVVPVHERRLLHGARRRRHQTGGPHQARVLPVVRGQTRRDAGGAALAHVAEALAQSALPARS